MSHRTATLENGVGPPRFVRRTALRAGEYRKNFQQIDADIIAAVTSNEADRVTPLMSKIYLRLVSAPPESWEREGVLYFMAREVDGRLVKASKVLYELLGVASATAHKALQWMHEQGIIGYYAGKNGAGIRIFLNRASGSIGVRAPAAVKKILPFVQGSNGATRGSAVAPAFNDSFADSEVLETDLNPCARKSRAEQAEVVKIDRDAQPTDALEEIVARLSRELEPSLQSAARQAAAREHERTREWLESRGLPKAARVAQREAYNLLRKYGVLRETAHTSHAEVGRSRSAKEPQALSDGEVEELAQACVAMFEVKGQPFEQTLSEMSADAGGFLQPEEVRLVRARAEALLSG